MGAALLAVPALLATSPPAGAQHTTCLGVRTTLDGSDRDDLLYGTLGDDSVAGFGGSDHLYGRGGDDRLCGGSGSDFLFDGSGRDAVDGGAGVDVLYLCQDFSVDTWTNVERVVSSGGCS